MPLDLGGIADNLRLSRIESVAVPTLHKTFSGHLRGQD